MAKRPRKLSKFRGSGLDDLVAKADSRDVLRRAISAALPDDCASHIVTAALEGDTLTLVVDSAAWLTQIRFAERQMLQDLARLTKQSATRINYRVVAAGGEPRNVLNEPNPISEKNRNLIAATADSIDDSRLSAALRRLAGRRKQND